jgi:penicillin-binding protein 2
MILDDIPIQRRSSQTPPPDNQGGRLRLIMLGIGVLLVFALMSVRLFDLQVNRQRAFSAQVNQRSTLTQRIAATRGLIYDRNGEPLVRNAPAYQVAIIPVQQVTYRDDPIKQRLERTAVYNKLAAMIGDPTITAGDIYTRVVSRDAQAAPYRPVVVADNVPREKALAIQEQSLTMRGVVVQTVGSREYPYKELLGNILGYTGRIFREMVDEDPAFYSKDNYDYDNDRVGITGIEKTIEGDVRGVKGSREVLVDVAYEELQVLNEVAPINGNSVRLTLDLRLQKIMSDVILSAMKEISAPRAAAVAINPNTGEILGMFSAPGYDNNLFAQGVSQNEFDKLAKDLHKPLLNHATQDVVPPGSTFKIVTTAALLQEGAVTEQTVINDPGVFELPNIYNPTAEGQKFYCWIGLRGQQHGPQTIRDALKNSCNTYYRKAVGGYAPEGIAGMDNDKLAAWAKQFGIGQTYDHLGIDYTPGSAPTENDKLRRIGEVWTTGDSYNVAIGQGFLLATPLEMANITAIVANGGTLYEPQLVREVINDKGEVVKPYEPRVIRNIPLDPYYMALIQDSMRRVVNEEGGTAYFTRLEGFEFAGKTGTAEFCDDVALETGICYLGIKVQPTHAWFVAYAPVQNPQIAISVYVWHGGQGSGVAAPITQRILNEYFNVGVPADRLSPLLKSTSE